MTAGGAASATGLGYPGVGDWPTYMHDTSRSGVNAADTTLSVSSAPTLRLLWTYQTGGAIQASTAVADGVVYVGSWDGSEYALNVTTGQLLWSDNFGTFGAPGCSPLGITGTATVSNGTVYVSGADGYFYALNPGTGAIKWDLMVMNQTSAYPYPWSSPLVVGNTAYLGIAARCESHHTEAGLREVNLLTHAIVGSFNTSNFTDPGSSVWGSPTYDAQTHEVYFGTGDDGTMLDSVVALNATTLGLVGNWTVPISQQIPDGDFGNTPTLFTNATGGVGLEIADKNGHSYAFNVTDIPAGPIWQDTLAVAGPNPIAGDGSISPGVFNGANLFLGGGSYPIGAQNCSGTLREVNPSNGAFVWQLCTPGPVLGGLAYANGVLVDAAGTTLQVRQASTGTVLWSTTGPAALDAAPTLAEGRIFEGNVRGLFSVYGFQKGTWSSEYTPPALANASGAYDPATGDVLVFGGCSANLCPSPQTYLLVGGVWTSATPALPNATNTPSARVDASLVYDATDGYFLLFGGRSAAGVALGDTWEFANGVWKELTPHPAPPGRWSAGMVYDTAAGSVVLFGGLTSHLGATSPLGDTWTFASGAWTNVTATAGTPPSPRSGPAVTYDPAIGGVALFGGLTATGAVHDTWTFVAGRWSLLSPTGTPQARSQAGLVYEPTTGSLYLFGGVDAAGAILSDPWTYTSGTWTKLNTSGLPFARSAPIFVYDAAGGYALLFSGMGLNDTIRADAWELNGTNWTRDYPAPPIPAVKGLSAAFDAGDNELVEFGGQTNAGYTAITRTSTGGPFQIACASCTPGVTEPKARAYAGMVDDPAIGGVVVFGGIGNAGLYNDTWVFSAGTWAKVAAASTGAPSPRWGAATAYDPLTGQMFLFGGTTATGDVGDTWVLAASGWTQLTPPHAPTPRTGAAMAFDSSIGKIVLFGGENATAEFNDTWTYQNGSWHELAPDLSPSPRAFAALADDPAGSTIVLVGGTANGTVLGDEWEYVHGTWVPVLRATVPPPTADAAFVWDPQQGGDVLLGGEILKAGVLVLAGTAWNFGNF